MVKDLYSFYLGGRAGFSLVVSSSQLAKHHPKRSFLGRSFLVCFAQLRASESYRCNPYRLPAASFLAFFLYFFPL